MPKSKARIIKPDFLGPQFKTFAKRLFLPPVLFANAHLLLKKLRFAA